MSIGFFAFIALGCVFFVGSIREESVQQRKNAIIIAAICILIGIVLQITGLG